jgi:hypothetical protein
MAVVRSTIFPVIALAASILISSGCEMPIPTPSQGRSADLITTSAFNSTPLTPSTSAATATVPLTAATARPSATQSPEPTPLGRFVTPKSGAQINTSIAFERNGKRYAMPIGISSRIGASDVSGSNGGSARLIWSGDIDKDGEAEYFASFLSCGAYCYEEISVYDFDAAKDAYFVAGQLGTKGPALETIDDFNHDGNPEMILRNYGFCHGCATATLSSSALAIMRFSDGNFREVTSEYPDKIRADAEVKLKTATGPREPYDAPEIALASFLFDKNRLGEIKDGLTTFDRICLTAIAPTDSHRLDCAKYRIEVESAIAIYATSP